MYNFISITYTCIHVIIIKSIITFETLSRREGGTFVSGDPLSTFSKVIVAGKNKKKIFCHHVPRPSLDIHTTKCNNNN